MTEPTRVLSADPPWAPEDQLPGKGRGSSKHYETMTVDEIANFDISAFDMAKDSALFLWRLASMQEEACQVARAWGFEVKSEIVWDKETKHGKMHFGMGRIVRASHEVCLIATRGKPQVKSRSVRSRFEAPDPLRFGAPVRRHSEKPDVFYDIVEQLYDGPYVELFARRDREGWTCHGLEVS